ncbi:hypothetical protein B0H14DRAFT_3454498 [Mycena olivaceomarginata]|nr:hypothetical protein B0H14DRAFT_3454498 [Mycena olivaceomarginata]
MTTPEANKNRPTAFYSSLSERAATEDPFADAAEELGASKSVRFSAAAKGKGKAAPSSAEQDDGVDLDTQQNVDGKHGVVHDSKETRNENASAEGILVDFIGMESPTELAKPSTETAGPARPATASVQAASGRARTFVANQTAGPKPVPGGVRRTLSALPPHLLLRIVNATLSDAHDVEKQRKTLYWLTIALRLVNRVFYTTSMNVLRSVYLPSYTSLIRPPYTSDPFPFSHPPTYTQSLSASVAPTQTAAPRSALPSLQRETPILDRFIALKVRDDVWTDDSDLHLSHAEPTFADMFSLTQPRARIEDLVREYGVAEGVVYIDRRRGGAGADKGPTSVVLRSDASYAALTQRLASSARSSGSSFWRSPRRQRQGAHTAHAPPLAEGDGPPAGRSPRCPCRSHCNRVGLVLTTGGGASKSKRNDR